MSVAYHEEPQAVIARNSPEFLAENFNDAVRRIREACAEIHRQECRLAELLGDTYAIRLETRHLRFDSPDDEIKALSRSAWGRIVNIAGIRKLLSVKKAEELDEQLRNGTLPPLTADSIRAVIEEAQSNSRQYLFEAVKEVHDWLRPRGDKYKTNSRFDIGERVILEWSVERVWSRRQFRVRFERESRFRAIDNVFAMLDGKPGITTHNGWLCDAISASEGGQGQTDFFEFKAFQNGNLHLRFKRLDLLERLNAIAGGNALYAPTSV